MLLWSLQPVHLLQTRLMVHDQHCCYSSRYKPSYDSATSMHIWRRNLILKTNLIFEYKAPFHFGLSHMQNGLGVGGCTIRRLQYILALHFYYPESTPKHPNSSNTSCWFLTRAKRFDYPSWLHCNTDFLQWAAGNQYTQWSKFYTYAFIWSLMDLSQ